MNEIVPFSFESFVVRVLPDDSGNPWFVAADVCDALDIKNVTQAVNRLDDDERSMFNIGRQGETNVINESGLYSLILGSRKPEAKRFKKWVTSEVLPAIRKTGRYETKPAFDPNSLSRLDIARMLLESETEKLALEQEKKLLEAQKAEQATKIEEQAIKIESDAPKVELHDSLIVDVKFQRSIRETSKELNLKEHVLRTICLDIKWIFKNKYGCYEPYAATIQAGYMVLREEVINGRFVQSPAFTFKGIEQIKNNSAFKNHFSPPQPEHIPNRTGQGFQQSSLGNF